MTKIKFTKCEDYDLSPYYCFEISAYRLNMSVMEAYESLEAKDYTDFYRKVREIIDTKHFVILPSDKDLEDYRRINAWFPEFGSYAGPKDMEPFYCNVLECLDQTEYRDIPFEKNGKKD